MDNKPSKEAIDLTKEALKEIALENKFYDSWDDANDADDFPLGKACGLDPEVCESCQ